MLTYSQFFPNHPLSATYSPPQQSSQPLPAYYPSKRYPQQEAILDTMPESSVSSSSSSSLDSSTPSPYYSSSNYAISTSHTTPPSNHAYNHSASSFDLPYADQSADAAPQLHRSSASSIKSSSSSMSELDVPIQAFETTLNALPTCYELVAYLPGISCNDSITIAQKQNRTIHIVADKLYEAGSHYEQKVVMPLDARMDDGAVRAKFIKDGVLKLTVPRRASLRR